MSPAHETRFTDAVSANERDLLRYFLRRIPNPADAAEAHGELLMTAWRLHRRLPHDRTQARMWLFGIAHNVLRSARRASARHTAAMQTFIDEARTLPMPQPEAEIVELRDAIASLPPAEAELVRLIYWDGFKSHEAAAILGINASTARSRLTRAKARLHTLLRPPSGRALDAAASPG